MKTLITNLAVAGTIALLLIVACTREIPVEVPATVVVTVETEKRVLVPVMTKVPVTVEVPATVEVEVTREVKVPATVEVTREVAMPVTVQVPVEVTREIDVTRIVQVPATVEVEVTREVKVPATVEVTREVAMPVTVQVPVEVTREIDVTRIVEVPVTVEVEVAREVQVPVEMTPTVEVTPTAVASVAGPASSGGGEDMPGWTTPTDPPEILIRATEKGVWCADNPTERIEWYYDHHNRMLVSQWPCKIDQRSEGYVAELHCYSWKGGSGYRAFSHLYINHNVEGTLWENQRKHHIGYFRAIELEYPQEYKQPTHHRQWVLEGLHRIKAGGMGNLGCEKFRYIFGTN